MAMSTALFSGEAESGVLAAENAGMLVSDGGDDAVEKRPKQSSGHTVRR